MHQFLRINQKIIFAFLFVISFFSNSCSKKNDKKQFTYVYHTDATGTELNDFPTDGQWKPQHFTKKELEWFNGLDTVSIYGTLATGSITHARPYPNPFTNVIRIANYFDNPAIGEVVIKYVVVNSNKKIVQKGALRMDVFGITTFAINTSFEPGVYQLYYIIGFDKNEHFFQTSGLMEKY